MKIRIIESSSQKKINLLFPTRLLLSPGLLRMGIRIARRHDAKVPDISRQSFRQLKKIILDTKKRNKDWVLVDVESSDGDKVKISF